MPVAVIASGETMVDSISVAGLAGYADAPILLTPGDSLQGSVADFIEDYGVGAVYVLGGTAAISDAVVTAIEGLTTKPTVTRIGGPDRYATAAMLAAKIETDSSWCGTEANSAVLINGATDMLGYGVAVQTIAFRLQIPLLMTAHDELPTATRDFIEDNNIEHVQIMGSEGVVSAGVMSALTSLGVDTVDRTDAAGASDISVKLAELVNNGCNDDVAPVSRNRVVLVRGNPDGIAAAPVLSSSLTGGALVTPLIVGDTLPASVRDYLAATPKTVGPDKLNLGIVAIGGTAAVSDAVMKEAIAAATSSGALTVRIGAGDNPGTTDAKEGDTNKDGVTNADDPVRPSAAGATTSTFALYFSDDVTSGADAAADDGLAVTTKLQDMVEVNGIPADVDSAVTGVAGAGCAQNVVYVTLGQTLAAGDVISVASSALKLGTQKDARTVVPASTTVTAAPKDTGRPQISIIGIAGPSDTASTPGPNNFTLTITDPGGLAADTLTADDFSYTAGSGSLNTSSTSTTDPAITFGTAAIPDTSPTTHTTTVIFTSPLVAGDRLTLKASRIKDKTGNLNSPKSGTAIKAQASPKITSVLMSNLKHSAHNTWTLPDTAVDATTASGAANALTISAKATGAAAGAAGNEWTIVFDTAGAHMATKPLDIDVRVDSKSKRATVRFVNGQPTARQLVAELKATSDFDSLFAVALPCTGVTDAKLGVSNANRNVAATATFAGRTQFAIEVNFNRYIHAVEHAALLDDVLAAAVNRSGVSATDILADAISAAGTGGGGLSLLVANQAAVNPPTKKVRYQGETSRAGLLPMSRDLVETTAGHSGADNAQITTAIPHVATGYATDAPVTSGDDLVEEDKNAKSQNRITVTSSVKARN